MTGLTVAPLAVPFSLYQLDGALGGDGTARLLYLVLLLAFVVGFGARLRRARLGTALKGALAWAAIFLTLIALYAFREEARLVYDRVAGEVSPTLAISREEGVAELRKGWDGHFRAGAEVNGAPIDLLVDTGASVVTLSYRDAEAAGLDPARLVFDMPVSTANGPARVASVRLDRVSVGDVGLDGVDAAVAEPGRLRSSLLGMSFLGRLAETSFRRDRLILRN